MIHPLEPKVLIEFVLLFLEEQIKFIRFELYNGTASRVEEIDPDTYIERNKFTISGKKLEPILRALEKVEFNQIKKVTVEVGEHYHTCSLDAVSSEMSIYSVDELDMSVIKAFHKKHLLEKTTITL